LLSDDLKSRFQIPPPAALAALAGLFGAFGGATAEPKEHPLEFRLYGDVRYSHHDYGPDQKSGANGSPPDSRATMDLSYVVTTLEFAIRPDLEVEVEVEFEHGGTGSALELEYEEFGEYDLEVEKGGEVAVEEFHLTKTFHPSLRLRAGHFLTAVGLANRSHRPTDFFPSQRAEAEAGVIPTTWDETGVEIFGSVGRFAYRAQVVPPVTASFGVAWLRTDEPFEDLVARADRALYRAKQSGRNRVVDELH
jgi:hypothetical protein